MGPIRKAVGGQDFDNVSLMAVLQPSVTEAVEATHGTPITRTKLRLVSNSIPSTSELHQFRASRRSPEGQSVFNPRLGS